MRHFGKSAFAMLLALMLCLSLFPSALAEDAGSIAAEDAPEQEVTIALTEEGTISPVGEGTIAPAEEDALPRTDEIQAIASGQCGDSLIWTISDDGVLTISGTGEMWDWTRTEYAWPSTPWQATVSRISSVRIEPGVTSIGGFAFYGCQSMTEISIAETVTRIGAGAFCACSGLLSLTIPEGVTSIEWSALESCYGLKSIRIPKSLTAIEEDLFSSCTGLTDIYYGGTQAEWKNLSAIYDAYKVAVHCTDGDLNPADTAYCGDDLIWRLDDDGTMTVSGSGDMWDFGYDQAPWCQRTSEIKQLCLMSGVTSIGNYAFVNCPNLNSASLPASLTRIGEQLFRRCGNLTDIYYGGTMAEWKRLRVVYDHYKVAVHCADGELSPADTAFCGDNLVWSLDDNGIMTITGSGDMWDFDYGLTLPWESRRSEIKQLRLTNGVTSIGSRAFMYCDQLSSVTLPEGLTRVGYSAFNFCESLWALTLPETVTSIGSGAFSGSSIYSFVIPEGVTSIESGTFSYCANLTSVIIPETVTDIGAIAFYGCYNLTGVKIPERVTSIGWAAFKSCYSMESITIPANVSRIEIEAFAYSGLKKVYFHGPAPLFVSDNVTQNQFGRVTATAYYPAEDASWTESVRQNYGGDITWEPYLSTNGLLSLGDATACAGRSFTVDLTLDENPGVMGISFQLDYDSSVMEFVGAEDGALTGWTVNAKKNILVWDDDREHTDTGCLLKLKFRLKEDAVPGETRIGITDLDVGNYNEDNLYFQVRSGRVTVLVHRPGDANGDGKVNVNDLIRLRKYLVGAEKEIIAGNADVNADEVVDILDLVRLRKYIAQVDGVILE